MKQTQPPDAAAPSTSSGQELRRSAEERLSSQQKTQTSEAGGQIPTEATARTLHELRVHQIELEMQNEELKTSQAKVGAALALYRLNHRKYEGDYNIRTKSGSTRIWDFSSSPLGRLPDGCRLVMSMAMDVTERRAAEHAVRQLNTELEQRIKDRTAELEAANHELEAFSYSVSHDLRAPLRGIDGWAQAIVEDFGDKLGESGRQMLNRQRAASQRMAALIDDLLQLSRLTRQPLWRQTVAMPALVRRVWTELRLAPPAPTAELVVGALCDCQADPALLAQVFVNLLGNALKFSGGHAHPRIEVGCQAGPAPDCVYFVKDNGAGFDMRYAHKLFNAFQRLHNDHEFPGTGIGLALTQRIIRRHGGRIWAESAVGQGATFYFTLPGDRPPEESAPKEEVT